eukprot:CAMPEP_0176448834 /NCGR_PEP_ID=MMETSP0127-20121128/26065_1 /TAXON_ID=938130 /ORGANISM="Platyophrya macrostoma, Strain WH" /LENGTH=1012 /DNA_ID=CAMNT_0017835951 /DNA_START=78 /DNA_END=3116 /DNA_ORIENTATION=+
MGKLISLRVFIQGLRGIGIEVAKNLILAGPKQVVLQDSNKVEIRDLGCNFYLQEADVGKASRAEASLRQLRDLNPYVKVEVHDAEVTEDFLSNFDVVVFTDSYDVDKLIKFNNFCRNRDKPIGFIYTGLLGLYGFTFVDFGPKFACLDATGEDPKSAIISNITCEATGIVTTHEDKRHGFEDGDTIVFKEVKGMSEINGQRYVIKVLSPFQFSIGDTSAFGKYLQDGIAEQIKVPTYINFKSLEESLAEPLCKSFPMFENPDLDKWGRSELLHVALRGLLDFCRKKERLPKLHCETEAEELVGLATLVNAAAKEHPRPENVVKVDDLDDSHREVIKNIARFAQANLTPHASFWGGIVAQEIVKITGKYMPLRQWLHYDTFESLPEEKVDRTTAGSRYDDYISVYGVDIQEKLLSQKFFLVGAGALGCEFIKSFALMGLACGKGGKLVVTDDDNIEISNLNRQFLFRKENVGSSKAKTAGEVGKRMNPHLNVEALKLRVAPENEEVFNDQFWDSLNGVTNAVDNVHARKFVDSMCVFYSKHLFESGTLGTKCNSQMVIPFHTQSYGESEDPPEENIPLCTLKNFPYQIEHTIQWGRDFFEGTFVEGPNATNKYLENPAGYIASISKELKDSPGLLKARLETVNKIFNEFSKASHENCVALARDIFQELFYNNIAQLVYNLPIDHKNEAGLAFWSGPKRFPGVIAFDVEDPIHVDFIFSTANLFAYVFNLPPIKDRKFVAEVAGKLNPKKFEPKKGKIGEGGNTENSFEDDDLIVKELTEFLSKQEAPKGKNLQTIEFEKDDDTNFHIDFIAAVANLRARNYKIEEASRHKVKMIAGKIIPAIATTTAMVVGAVCFEILKFIVGKKPTDFRNSFANLAIPLWLFSEPLPPNKKKDKEYDEVLMGPIKAIPSGWTVWDREVIQGPKTLGEIFEHYKTKYGVNLSIVNLGNKCCLYNKFSSNKAMGDRLKLTPLECVKLETGTDYPAYKKFMDLDIAGETDDMTDCVMPHLKYIVQ